MGDGKSQVRRYSLVVLVSSVAAGFLLMFAWKWTIDAGMSHRVGWITRLGTSARQIIAVGLFCSPFLAATLLLDRAKKKLIGTDRILAQRADERRRRSEENVGVPVMFILALLLYPRVKVTLISDGVVERLGRMKNLILYASIRRVCIVPSRRRRALKCVAIFSADGGVERWHHYDFGKGAPVGDIVKEFEAKGVLVEQVIEGQGGEGG